MNEDLKIIKKKYGEEFMHFCRESFPILLETPSLLSGLILDHFDVSKELYKDIKENDLEDSFKNYIYSLVDVEKNGIKTNKTPKELLNEAEYDFYECKTEEDIQQFKKYYITGEELCTFNGGRLNRCHVFWAVKKNVEKIKRENFKNPNRQDEYGTSVISIQFTRDKSHALSIKNRYNHRVNNPDATFSNNLDNIIPGLTESFENAYGLIQQNKGNKIEIPGYVMAKDGKYYKYNYEINNIYYCPNNIIIDNFEVKKYDKEKYIIMDYFILDLQNKKLYLYDGKFEDSFENIFKNISKITIKNIDKGKEIIVECDKNIVNKIILDSNNNIISLDSNINIIYDYFLYCNKKLTELNLPEVKNIRNCFLYYNENLTKLSLPEVENIGDYFLYYNQNLTELNLPKVKNIRNGFLYYNENLIELNLPKVKNIGNFFLCHNQNLIELNLLKVKNIGKSFIFWNQNLKKLGLPMVKNIGNDFLFRNKKLTKLNLPQVKNIGYNFLNSNKNLTELNLPKVENIGNFFLCRNQNLTELNLLKVKNIGYNFLFENENLTKLNLPLVESIDFCFLQKNNSLKTFIAPTHIYNEYREKFQLPPIDKEKRKLLIKQKNKTER